MNKLHQFFETLRERGRTPVLYFLSSCLAFVIDFALLLLFNSLLPFSASMEIGALLAWVISSLTNFYCNRNLVFHSSVPLKKAFLEYYSLAAVVFLVKTYVILELLTRGLHLSLDIAKLIAEAILFCSNYIIQKKFIFKKNISK